MLRRLCAALAAVLMLMAGCAALAEARINFADFTLDELYALRTELDAAIAALERDEGEVAPFESGMYLVGTDIPEGDYAIVEDSSAMFASVVVRMGETEDSSLIYHKLVTGRADIRLRRDTWVTFTEVLVWPLGMEPDPVDPDGVVGEGAYLVGIQLPQGQYTVSPKDMAPLSSYSIFAGIPGQTGELTRFEVIHGDMALNLKEGDYIELSGCTLSRVENEPQEDE